MQDIITYQRDVLNGYRLILDPPPATKRKIAAARTRLDAFFPGTPIAEGSPFVYLASFFVYDTAEDAVIDQLNRIALGAMPFKIHLKGYGHLEEKEICIQIAETGWVSGVIDKIAQVRMPWTGERFNPLPRISLARNLLPWQFERIWPYFEKEPFQSRFVVNGMRLLKQAPGYRSWQILRHFLFENQLITD
ncbi:2'-5' RNA ligase family protein [Niabella aurantiaca]|uniref:2'-5' RNA ligase family protein n=1 Tax=Niabella aurantiaca TaxID=379900 RepID=UPI00036D4EE7|nr:2'-5' RNA ligase family protein [Niabella aurantiaca]